MKLWHCAGARSLRPLWALEEMKLDYEIEILPFTPRICSGNTCQSTRWARCHILLMVTRT